jgi:hypothetical protein
MRGIQKEKFIISKHVHYTDICFEPLQRKILGSFFWLLPTLVDSNVGTPGGTTNIQMICKLSMHFEACWGLSPQHPLCELSTLNIVVFDLVDEVRDHFNQTMPCRWIHWSAPIAWPPRSPNLTPFDFLLWSYVKTICQVKNDLQQLKGCRGSSNPQYASKHMGRGKISSDIYHATRGVPHWTYYSR